MNILFSSISFSIVASFISSFFVLVYAVTFPWNSSTHNIDTHPIAKMPDGLVSSRCTSTTQQKRPENATQGIALADTLFASVPSVHSTDSNIFFPISTEDQETIDSTSISVGWSSSDSRIIFIDPFERFFQPAESVYKAGYVAFYPTAKTVSICLSVRYTNEEEVFLTKQVSIPAAEIREFVDDPQKPTETKRYYRIIHDTFSLTHPSNEIKINQVLYNPGSPTYTAGGKYGGLSLEWSKQFLNWTGNALQLNFNFLNQSKRFNGDLCGDRVSGVITHRDCTENEILNELNYLTTLGTQSRPPVCPTIVPATATAAIDAHGSVTSVTVTNNGSGYISFPVVSFSSQGGAVPPTVRSVLSSTGEILRIDIVHGGSGYTTSPTISFASTCTKGSFVSGLWLSPVFKGARYITKYTPAEYTHLNTGVDILGTVTPPYNRTGVLYAPYTYLRGFFNPEVITPTINGNDFILGNYNNGSLSNTPAIIASEIHGGQFEPRISKCSINDSILTDHDATYTYPLNLNRRYNIGFANVAPTVINGVADWRCNATLESEILINPKYITRYLTFFKNDGTQERIDFGSVRKGRVFCRNTDNAGFADVDYSTATPVYSANNGCNSTQVLSSFSRPPLSWFNYKLEFNFATAHGFRYDLNLTSNGVKKLFKESSVSWDDFSVWLPVDEDVNNFPEPNYFPRLRGHVGIDNQFTGKNIRNELIDEYEKNRSREIEKQGGWKI